MVLRVAKCARQTHTSRIHHRGARRIFLSFFLSGAIGEGVIALSQRGRLVYFMYHSHASLTLEMHRHAKVDRKLMRWNKLNQHFAPRVCDENVDPRVVHTHLLGGEQKIGP